MEALDLGKARLSPRRAVVAGSFTTLTYTYTAGHPVDDTGYLKIAFRYAGDFGTPQFHAPTGPNFCSVRTDGDCLPVPRWDPKGHTRPWGAALYVKITRGFLDSGRHLTIVFGDRTGGSPGWQMQTFCERTLEFKSLIDPIATYEFKELPVSPTLRVVPGAPVRAICLAPSQVQVGAPFICRVKSEDRWGNPVGMPRRIPQPAFRSPGIRTIRVKDPRTGLAARSHPIRVTSSPARLTPYWADFHGQSEETIGTNSIDDYYTFARDYAGLDIAAHQGNDFQVTDALWTTINGTARAFYRAGRFVTFPGYEWSGNTPLGGDRNVYYGAEGGKIVHSCHDLLPGKCSAFPVASTATELFERLDGPEPFVFAHVGGRYADLAMHAEGLESAVEIHSAWGTFEWLLDDALTRRYRVGVVANSDGHKGRPGASYPGAGKFGSLGGLTCVLARRLTRRAVLDAVRARHVYATTGARILLDVSVEAGSDHAIMGDLLTTTSDEVGLTVEAAGTAALERIDIVHGTTTVFTQRPYAEADLGRRVKIVWSGAEVKGRARMTEWDGHLTVRGNRIRRFTPINFWNPARAMTAEAPNRLTWQSVTTGGLAGVILELEHAARGTVRVETRQGPVEFPVREAGLEPLVWSFGGLRKQVAVIRLPDRPCTLRMRVQHTISDLRRGDNPVHVRLTQEDGHQAWSSPVYVDRSSTVAAP